MRKRILISSFVILFMLLIPTFIFAEYDPGCDCDPGSDPDAVAAPFDGGISLLIAAGVGIGAKKAYDKKKEDKKEK